MAKDSTMTLGIDLGDEYSQVCVLDAEGEVIEEGRIRTTEAAFERRVAGLEGSLAVIEVGTHSPWVSRLLAEWGHEVLVANPRKVALIARNDSEDDPIDA